MQLVVSENSLLVGDDRETLCKFLDKPRPNESYPPANEGCYAAH